MKKLLLKNKIIVLLVALSMVMFSLACIFAGKQQNNGVNSYVTGGIYTAFAQDVPDESEEQLKGLKSMVSNDGKYLLLVTAFDDTLLNQDGLYYIGYKYTFNGQQVNTTQIPNAKTSTYYGAISLNTSNGAITYGAKDIYANDSYENYGLIVYEVEFENTYQEDGVLLEDLHAFIDQVEDNGEGGYNVLNSINGKNYRNKDEFRVANSNFDNGLDGWEFNNISGDQPFAGVHANSTFWGEGYAMNNVGNYFSSYADGASEGSTGTLASPLFKVGGTGVITYMLGGAGNTKCFITLEDADGNVLALYRNTRFTDFPAGDFTVEQRREMIGNTVFLANFVTYKADLSAYMGQQVKIVIHDLATASWGVVFFDELNTYYAKESLIPESAINAENLLANKTSLLAELELEVSEQGDYTLDSYNDYSSKLAQAKDVASAIYSTQTEVDNATTALSQARLALQVRSIEEISGTIKSFRLMSGNNTVITLADFVNVNQLSSITYNVSSNNAKVVATDVVDGTITVTAGEVDEQINATVTVEVLYKGEIKLTLEFAIQISNELAPTAKVEEVNKPYDLYQLDDKESIVIDFAENVDNPSDLELTYSASYKGSEIQLNGSLYTFNFNGYDDKATVEAFKVTVSFVANGQEASIEFVYNLVMTDSTAYRLVNGGFEQGLEGWSKVGKIGDVSTESHYWVEEWENNGKGYEFGRDGEKMFSAYAPGGVESAVGTLTSSVFKVGGSGFVTFKLGAAKDGNYVYVDVVDANTKQILKRYYNGLWSEYTNDLKSGCTLVAFKADLSEFNGKEVFFRISDNADSGYGLFFVDSFNTYYETEPADFNVATPVGYEVSGTIYDLFNGGFEMGGVEGWWNVGEPGHVTNADAFFSGASYEKVGNYLYSGVEDFGAGNGLEGNKGTLTSSAFELGGCGWISFKLGGGGNELCYVQILDAVTHEVLARYHQQDMRDAVLIQYKADLSAYVGRTIRVQVCDYAFNNWGCVSFDNVITYYANVEALPEGSLLANDIKDGIYDIKNGSFETGNLDGWKMNVTEHGALGTVGYVISEEINEGWYTKNDGIKDGNFLFSFACINGGGGVDNCENTKGTLESSIFTLKGNSFVSFKFGGAGGVSNRDVKIELVRADGVVLETFFNECEGKQNTRMNSYYFQYQGLEVDCFFRVVDNSTGDYGCFVVDDFRVNMESAPDGYIPAVRP